MSRVKQKVLPSLTSEQIGYLIGFVTGTRDRAIISPLADSGMRLRADEKRRWGILIPSSSGTTKIR